MEKSDEASDNGELFTRQFVELLLEQIKRDYLREQESNKITKPE